MTATIESPSGLLVSFRNAQEFQNNVFTFFERQTFVDGGYRELARFDMFGEHYLVNDPIEVSRILTSNPDDGSFTKEGLRFFKIMRRMLGDGLFTVEGPSHLRQRRLMQPLFNQATVGEMARGMIRAASLRAEAWRNQVDSVVDVEREMQSLSSDVAAESLLGSDLRARAHEFGRLADELEEALWLLITAPFMLPAWVPGPNNRRVSASATRIHDLARRIIAARRDSIQASTAPDVILTRLVAAETESPAMGEERLVDEIVTLMVGGYKTLAVAYVWTFYLLAMNPLVAARVREELRGTLGGRVPAPEDLPRLAYVRNVAQEALRLYPPIWGIFRIAAQDVVIGGRRVRRGATLLMSPYTLHRNPRYWPNALAFDPDNFRSGFERPAAAWIPFGAGRHKCIGNHYALSAVALSVATLAREFSFDPPDRPAKLTTRNFTSPKGGMRLRLRRIDS